MITLLLVDHHAYFRSGLRQTLEAQGEFRVIAEAASGAEALAFAQTHAPDVVVLDFHLPDTSSHTLAAMFLKIHPRLPVVILSLFADAGLQQMRFPPNVQAMLAKEADAQSLFATLRAVALPSP